MPTIQTQVVELLQSLRGEETHQVAETQHLTIADTAICTSRKPPSSTRQRQTTELPTAAVAHVLGEERHEHGATVAAEVDVADGEALEAVVDRLDDRVEIELHASVGDAFCVAGGGKCYDRCPDC